MAKFTEAVRVRLESSTLRGLLARHLGVSPMRLTMDRDRMDRSARWIVTPDDWVKVNEFTAVAEDAVVIGVKRRGLARVKAQRLEA